MSHLRVWHVSFMCLKCLIYVGDMSHLWVWHVSFTCVIWHVSFMCDMSHSCVWRVSFMCVTWHVSFMCVTCVVWLIHTWHVIHTWISHTTRVRRSGAHLLDATTAGMTPTWVQRELKIARTDKSATTTQVRRELLDDTDKSAACYYVVATSSSLLQIIGLFWKRAL